MLLPQLRRTAGGAGTDVLTAESALVEQYGDLVRLAYLVLPASLNRHRRVLLAHSLVQRALPHGRAPRSAAAVPPQRHAGQPAGGGPALDPLRTEVVRGALAHERRPRVWPARLSPPRALAPHLPLVLGLRLFPRSGGAHETALVQALSGVSAPVRAAFVLGRLDGLSDAAVRDLLVRAGAPDARGAVRAAARLEADAGEAAAALLASREFDACTVQAHPTDLLRRRRRVRLAGLLGAGVVVAAAALVSTGAAGVGAGPDGSPRPVAGAPAAKDLVRTAPGAWDDTSRVDFTAWPARGSRARDDALLNRALAAWARPGRGTQVAYAKDTARDTPPAAPHLLFAGDLDGRAVVVLYDGQRLARYDEPSGTGGARGLTVARVDDADVTTAAAVTLDVRDGRARYLLAPWVAEAGTRDLARPDTVARPLDVSGDGVTAAVPVLSSAGGCGGSRPVLQLRSSSRIAEKHAFLLAGVGDLSPVHLTYTPLPGHGTPPARQPREATGSAALLAWAHLACGLDGVRGSGVRAVNAWDFAEQDLPADGGHAVWTCSRADTWRGTGNVTVALRTDRQSTASAAAVVAGARSTAECSRFGQHVVAGAQWRAPDGHWYLLAAGSRAVTGISVDGDVRANASGRTLAVRSPHGAQVRVSARLSTGGSLAAVGAPEKPE
ncbi:hypothetical protein ACIQU5_18565 [Streptomyces sp. NPDC090306]|uniref:hypothetical protein n=1 Tax=Streptomyces sp. NPDC090306 TaxID=3365961 RepID=UPI003806E5E4